MTDLASLQGFIEGYEVRPLPSDEPPTLMEIARFPHWENVYSNILAFLIRTEEVHGFGPLLIRSVLASYRDRLTPDRQNQAPDSDRVDRLLTVEREITTKRGNRIDILIEGTGFVVCIENKIRSPLNNDLADYRQYCEDTRSGCFLGIVLSPGRISANEISELEDPKGLRGEDLRFVSVTYSDIVAKVRERMGNFVRADNTRYQYLLFDFLEQAGRFDRSIMMNEEQMKFLEFWRKNERKIGNIIDHCDDLRELAENKTESHYDRCMKKLTNEEKEVFERYRSGKVFQFYLAGDGKLDGCKIALELHFDPLRIQHWLVKYGGSGLEGVARQIERQSDIEIELDPSSRKYKIVNEGDWSPYSESGLERAVETSVKILKAIAAMHLAREQLSQQTS